MRQHALAALLLLAAAAHPAVARDREERRLELEALELVATYAWPDEVQKGFFPIRVELANRGEERARVEVRARHVFGLDSIVKRVELAAGERIAFDLLGRGDALLDEEYVIELGSRGEVVQADPIGPSDTNRKEREVLLALSSAPPQPGLAARWTALLGAGDYLVEAARFGDMPGASTAYTSLDAVLLDTSSGLPPAEALAPLAVWVRTGGTLLLYGPLAPQLASASGELGPWIEERFLLEQHADGCRSYACAHGRIVLDESTAPLAGGAADALRLSAESASWVPGPGTSRENRLHPTSWPTPGLPLRTLAAILVIFSLVIGPVNFYVVRKLGRPVLLLLTVPAIALVSGVLLLVYGIVAQGLDVLVTRVTCTVLDQRSHRASTAEVRNFFAGLAPGPGLRPAPGTSVLCERNDGRDGRARIEERFRIELDDEGALLGEDYLPVRRSVPQVLLADAAARARVDFAREGDAIEATNGLGAPVLRLYLRSSDAAWYASEAPIAEGASMTLAPMAEAMALDKSGEVVAQILGLGRWMLPRDCYFAELARSPFTDPCGLEIEEVEARHYVLGVLEPGAGGER